MPTWWRRLTRRPDDLTAELEAHLAMQMEDDMARGLSPHDARRRFGNPTRIAEQARAAWGLPSLESLFQDIRQGFRGMRRSPAFAAVVILTFALGVGLNTAIFSVVRTVLLEPLPYPAAGRLVRLGEADTHHDFSVTWVNFQNWRNTNHTFEEMAAFQFTGRTLTGRGDPVNTTGLTVTAPFFSLLGMHPQLGRLFGEVDDRPGAPATIVLDHRFWSGQLGGDPHIVGATLTLNGTPVEVVGVTAPLWLPWKVDYYLPLGPILGNMTARGQHGSLRALARLKPATALAAAQADLDGIMRHLAESDPGPESAHRSHGDFLMEDAVGDVRGTLLALLAAAGLILLIACANIASLLLARGTARAGELALRRAIGAGRWRVLRQLLTETAVIATTGGVAGVLFARAALRLLVVFGPHGIPRLSGAGIDLPVLLAACGFTLFAGLLAGVVPALAAGRVDLASTLKEGSRASGAGRQRQALRSALVVAEVALTLVLAFGSGLLLRSLAAARNTNPGFDAAHVLTFSLQLPRRAYQTPDSVREFYDGLLAGLRSVPGVADARSVSCPPGGGDCGDWFYSIPGRPAPARDDLPIALFTTAGAGYFQMMRVPIRQGREFQETDRPDSPPIAVVNETFARTWWPHESAVGHQIKVGGPYQKGDLLEIVGVTGDIRQFGLDSKPLPEIFRPFAQQANGAMTVLLRTAGAPEAMAPAVRRAVLEQDRNLPLQRVGTLEDALGAGLAGRRFSTSLLALFAALAMLLAGVGIYGLLNYWVTSREPEIAVRLALGASPSVILRWAGLHAMRLAVAGVALGAAGGWAAARTLRNLVFGIPPRHPLTMLAAAAAVLLLALAAAALPAWRAARIDAARRLHAA